MEFTFDLTSDDLRTARLWLSRGTGLRRRKVIFLVLIALSLLFCILLPLGRFVDLIIVFSFGVFLISVIVLLPKWLDIAVLIYLKRDLANSRIASINLGKRNVRLDSQMVSIHSEFMDREVSWDWIGRIENDKSGIYIIRALRPEQVILFLPGRLFKNTDDQNTVANEARTFHESALRSRCDDLLCRPLVSDTNSRKDKPSRFDSKRIANRLIRAPFVALAAFTIILGGTIIVTLFVGISIILVALYHHGASLPASTPSSAPSTVQIMPPK